MVKQGTIFGPILCCSSTAKITELGEKTQTVVTPNLSIDSLIYVDDIGMAGKVEDIEEVGRKLKMMEEEKKFTFNNEQGKTNYMIIKTGKEEKQKPNIVVKKGKVMETTKYKYLGNWLNDKGNIELQLEELEKKVNMFATEVRKLGKEELLGALSTEAMIMIYEKTVVPTITYNLECWTHIDE